MYGKISEEAEGGSGTAGPGGRASPGRRGMPWAGASESGGHGSAAVGLQAGNPQARLQNQLCVGGWELGEVDGEMRESL